jgi:hypothetical protein
VELQAERKQCSWKTEEETAGANLRETERAKTGPVLVVHDDDNDDD